MQPTILDPRAPERLRAFTLLELLIVLVIVGIIIAFASLSVSGWGSARQARETSQSLLQLFQAAQNQAILKPALLGAAISRDGVTLYRYDSEPEASWHPLSRQSGLKALTLPEDVTFLLIQNNRTLDTQKPAAQTSPQILFSPTGDLTPFVLFIGEGDALAHSRIDGQLNGMLRLRELTEDASEPRS